MREEREGGREFVLCPRKKKKSRRLCKEVLLDRALPGEYD